MGSGAQDGVQNHLWTALQTSIQSWFSQKLEQFLGLGAPVWQVLNQGGVKLEEVGAMAWEGIKSSLPIALAQVLMETLIKMLIPGAGAVLVIIQGLQAAWGSLSRILQAIDKFISFLKAVKSGQSGPLFAQALAAAAVAVIDFVSEYLLRKLRGAASKIAAKVREIARRIGQRLRRTLRRLRTRLSTRGNARNGSRNHVRDRRKDDRHSQREAQKKQEAEERLKKAQQELKGKLAKGITGKHLKTYLIWLKTKYRLHSLYVENTGREKVKIVGKVNPEFIEWADKIVIVNKDVKPEDEKKAITSYFRAMSIRELQGIKKSQELRVKTDPQTGEGKGEFCLTQNKEYSQDLITRKNNQDRGKKGYDYAVMVEIEMDHDAMEQIIRDPRYVRSSVNAQEMFPNYTLHQPPERGVVVLKLESNSTTRFKNIGNDGVVVNYVILSRHPSDPGDIINKINASIRKISVIGAIKEVTPTSL